MTIAINNNRQFRVNIKNPAGYTTESQVVNELADAAGLAKTGQAVCNNVAYIIYGIVVDKVKQSDIYRHNVKHIIKNIHREWQEYDKRLLHASNNRMFCVGDLNDAQKAVYANITDRDYFEFWQATGTAAYSDVLTFINSLVYKYRKPFDARGARHSDLLAWIQTLHTALRVCEFSLNAITDKCISVSRLPRECIEPLTHLFSVARIDKCVQNLVEELTDVDNLFDFTDDECKNISYGVTQYTEKVTDPKFVIESIRIATEDYGKMFRTKGYQKKALKSIARAYAVAEEDEQEYKRNKLRNK